MGGPWLSQVTIDASTIALERVLAQLGKPAWDVTPDDMDGWWEPGQLLGIAASTRRTYVQAFKGFHEFLVARKAVEIEAAFGVRLESPLDEFNAARHVGNESAPSTKAPPTAERMEEFFEFLRDRIATARKFGSAGRDYALFRTLYHAGLRAEESAALEAGGSAFRSRPVRQAPCAFRQGRQDIGATARGGCRMLDGSGPDPALVP